MEADLAYYRRRQAEEEVAARSALNPVVRTTHNELAHLYRDRITALEERVVGPGIDLVSAA